eukprot:TRINITY_DN56574_c0_g1_i1.p3 TRINITY_DN56574_c0_g1~~TRINITY_DN56574_c0_g1_i1.p3  ORF type:complete len:134 (-),score=6.15 TRINITY_DN56574_c0_g1_i1:43-444(-)
MKKFWWKVEEQVRGLVFNVLGTFMANHHALEEVHFDASGTKLVDFSRLVHLENLRHVTIRCSQFLPEDVVAFFEEFERVALYPIFHLSALYLAPEWGRVMFSVRKPGGKTVPRSRAVVKPTHQRWAAHTDWFA